MSDNNIAIALIENDKVEFFSIKGEKIDRKEIENYYVYSIVPDNCFFFFQTQIASKRKAYAVVEAYAKSVFPVNNEFIGYVKGVYPIIGYMYFKGKVPKEFEEIVEKSDVVTTPFMLYLRKNIDKNFVYKSPCICAAYLNKELKYYLPNSGDCLDNSLDLNVFEGVEEIEYTKEIDTVLDVVKSFNPADIHLPINRESKVGIENWKWQRFAALAVVVLMFLLGYIFKYISYKKELAYIDKKINVVYSEALGNKKYSDPYGMLLYKAQYNGVRYDINPIRLLYALSKSKGYKDIKINYVSFDSNNGVKIMGSAKNYDQLVKYVNELSLITSRKFSIQNTMSKNGVLSFTLNYVSNAGE